MDSETLEFAQCLRFKARKCEYATHLGIQQKQLVTESNIVSDIEGYINYLCQLRDNLNLQNECATATQELKQNLKSTSKSIKTGYQEIYDQIIQFKTSLNELDILKNYYQSYLQLKEFLQPQKEKLVKSPSVIQEVVEKSQNILDTINQKYLVESVELLNFLILTQKQQIRRQNVLQKALTNLLQTTTEMQEMHYNISTFAHMYFQSFLRRNFAFEIEYGSQLRMNIFAHDISFQITEQTPKITPYDLVQHYIMKVNNLFDKVYMRDLQDLVLMLKSDEVMNYTNFQTLYELFEHVDSFLSMFWFRYLMILKSQFDIIFMNSAQFNKDRALKTLDGSRQYFKILVKYLAMLFNSLELEKIFTQSSQTLHISLDSGIQALINQYNFKFYLNETLTIDAQNIEKTTLQKLLSAGGTVLKTSLTVLTLSQKTSCKISNIKNCFERSYRSDDGYYQLPAFQQLFIDLLVRLIHGFLNHLVEQMHYTWQELKDDLIDDVLISCEQTDGILKDLLVQVVYFVTQLSIRHEAIQNE